jgi:NAD+ synthetase
MKVALAQLNPTIGDFAGNTAKVRGALERGAAAGAQLVVCPELCLTGYPPRDLLLRRSFVEQNLAALSRLAEATQETALLVGYVGENTSGKGRPLTNAAALLHQGRILATRTKTLLPSYDVFDEDRYFEPAESNAPVEFRGLKLGLTICEDVWNDDDLWLERRYRRNPPVELAESGADLLINLSASPWHLGKNRTRLELLRNLSRRTSRAVVFCNQVGGNDELIFDGGSLAFNRSGDLIAHGKLFAEDFLVVDLAAAETLTLPPIIDEQRIHDALVLGLRDYLHKCGFKSALLGLSGGIDSAVTAALAVAALGAENVRGISLPSQYSSQHSRDDARVLAENLGIRYDVIAIEEAFASVKRALSPVFEGRAEDLTEENIQARLRGVILMAMSNKFGSLLLTTGNKSEMAVGYCTLYGDMCGGLAVLSDVPKVMVYRLARWINSDASSRAGRQREIIPASSITKPPSAELRPDQKDQDSLPPYDELDAVLDDYVVRGLSPEEMMAAGHREEVVRRVVRLIDGSEYKRRQAAPGLKVTSKAFGVGRRIPIAQRHGQLP